MLHIHFFGKNETLNALSVAAITFQANSSWSDPLFHVHATAADHASQSRITHEGPVARRVTLGAAPFGRARGKS